MISNHKEAKMRRKKSEILLLVRHSHMPSLYMRSRPRGMKLRHNDWFLRLHVHHWKQSLKSAGLSGLLHFMKKCACGAWLRIYESLGRTYGPIISLASQLTQQWIFSIFVHPNVHFNCHENGHHHWHCKILKMSHFSFIKHHTHSQQEACQIKNLGVMHPDFSIVSVSQSALKNSLKCTQTFDNCMTII